MLFGNRWSNSSLPTPVKPDKLLVIAMPALRNWILSFATGGRWSTEHNNAQHPRNACITLTLTFATLVLVYACGVKITCRATTVLHGCTRIGIVRLQSRFKATAAQFQLLQRIATSTCTQLVLITSKRSCSRSLGINWHPVDSR